MGNPSPADWKRLWHELDRARIAQRLSWAAFSRHAGVSRQPIAAMREGAAIKRADKLASLERAAHWPLGTVNEVLRGQPVPMTDDDPTTPGPGGDEPSNTELAAKLDQLIVEMSKVVEALERLALLTPGSGVPLVTVEESSRDQTPRDPRRPSQ
jgi:hypothetical protein